MAFTGGEFMRGALTAAVAAAMPAKGGDLRKAMVVIKKGCASA